MPSPFGTERDFKKGQSLFRVFDVGFLNAVREAVIQVTKGNVGSYGTEGLNLPEYEPAQPPMYARPLNITLGSDGVPHYTWQRVSQANMACGTGWTDDFNANTESVPIDAFNLTLNPDVPIDGSTVVALVPGEAAEQLLFGYPQRESVCVEVDAFNATTRRISWHEIAHTGGSNFTTRTGGISGNTALNWAIDPNNGTISAGARGLVKRGYVTGGVRVYVNLVAAGQYGSSPTHCVQNITVQNAANGTFSLTLGPDTTSAVAYNVGNASLQTAINALASSPAVTVTGLGTNAVPFHVTFGDYQSWPVFDTDLRNLKSTQEWMFFPSSPAIVEANQTLLGRYGPGNGTPQNITIGSGLSLDVANATLNASPSGISEINQTLLGRYAGTTGSPQNVTIGDNLVLYSNGTLSASSSGISEINATILGRFAGSTGSPQNVTLGNSLILYSNGTLGYDRWDIPSYLTVGANAAITGYLIVGGNLTVNGYGAFVGNLETGGDFYAVGNATVAENATLGANYAGGALQTVGPDAAVYGTLSAGGNITSSGGGFFATTAGQGFRMPYGSFIDNAITLDSSLGAPTPPAANNNATTYAANNNRTMQIRKGGQTLAYAMWNNGDPAIGGVMGFDGKDWTPLDPTGGGVSNGKVIVFDQTQASGLAIGPTPVADGTYVVGASLTLMGQQGSITLTKGIVTGVQCAT